ncbi:chromosome segregation protein SMC [Homoserinibacter sp. YIM 151385]|uniref:chromosome segregation protein SMC n=1 Tax=Homoserinibacter sp. YIM 151385 TaxID=2985506 RepID=UPI0022F02B57|nr:chromosome segregation protein SMC [Homoserinibacter sp. YIM 151385]WBU39190.1 chromosome segregation protein SMC [Homoserinibacter sp. YIM 151385]
MYLKSLTLKGFKSFASPTTFQFEPGVTCVVGPNGSGKSNVVDALAWVMGEQGAKTLRGGKMEDVIFAGTSTRGPLGRAEVTLTIDNSDGALPIEYSEVTISRTLFRNGGSEYAINGQGCRLLDVQELLSDSGLGREMHVIVGQGQLDKILRATPEERRGFVEEAAGILKHRRRKEKTLRKLEAMQANLTRLSDLAGEIRRQLRPLGQQAEIAREAQTIQAVVRDARARLLADEIVELRRTLSDVSKSEGERKTERLVLQEQLDQAKLRQGRLEQSMTGDAVDEARRVAFALEQVQDRLRSLSALANQRLTLLSQQSELPGMSATVTQGMVDEAREEAKRLESGIAEAETALGRASAATATARASLDSLDEEISAQSALVSQHDLEQARLVSAVEVAASRLTATRDQLERQRAALEQAERRRDESRQGFRELDEGEDAPAGDSEAMQGEVERSEERVQSAQDEVERLRDELHAAERERDALAARVSALAMAVDQRDGSGAIAGEAGIRGIVSDSLDVEPGWEAAVAAALGPLAEAALADDRDAAHGALAHARDADAGRVEIVVADAAPGEPLGGLPAGAYAASSLVRGPAGVLGLLARVVLVEDVEAARAAWPALSGIAHVTVATRAGDILTEHVLRGGTGGRSRLELAAERDAAEEQLVAVTTTIERSSFALAEARDGLQQAKSTAQAAAAALREHDQSLAARSEALARARAQVEAVEAESERLTQAVDTLAEAARTAEQAVDQAVIRRDEHAATPRPILDVSARDGLLAELEAARAAEVEQRVGLETARERVRAQRTAAESLRQQLEAERKAAEEAARLAVLRQHQVAAASEVLDALPPVLASIDRSTQEARVELARAEADRAKQNEELSGLRAQEAGLRERLQGLNESVHGLEMQAYEKRLHLSSLLERAAGELGLVEDVLVAEYGPHVPVPADAPIERAEPRTADDERAEAALAEAPEGDPDAERTEDEAVEVADAADEGDAEGEETEPEETAPGIPFDRAEQRARLAKAERKLGQLGRVNPLALEEFAALEQRHRFLTEQLADLTATRKDLLTIIDELDERMRDIFGAAFEDTRAAFNRVFPVLFPGGSGSLQLTDPEHLLTTGIEVSVKPAGKKIERLSLLSGGERSLAAVALLIAIFKARPSPFYIMDEVEAALDDANLGRLLAIFEDLRESSQLIVITHQKRTMEIADALYGVSMRQDGVSAVVGQRVVSEAERAATAAAAG